MYQKYPVPQNHNNGASRFKKYGKPTTSINTCSQDCSLDVQQRDLGLQQKTIRIGKIMNCVNVIFFLLLICGSAITTIIAVFKKPESNEETFDGTVIAFAMFSGDKERKSLYMSSNISNDVGDCSLEQNKNNSRTVIEAMKGMDYRYSFILYGKTANTTSLKSAKDAIKELELINPSTVKQCNLTSRDDPVRTMFVQELSSFKERIMLVSLTADALKVKKTFELGDNVAIVGMDEDVSSKIKSFCTSISS